jgi:hypothetical protein
LYGVIELPLAVQDTVNGKDDQSRSECCEKRSDDWKHQSVASRHRFTKKSTQNWPAHVVVLANDCVSEPKQ